MQSHISREALYERVWTTPVKTLSADYGLSDVGLAKICRQHNIPLPPRGHWAKLEAGKKVYRVPLPRRRLGMPREIVFGANKWNYYAAAPKNLIDLELKPPAPFNEPLSAIYERLSKQIKKITISRDLTMAHPIIRKLLEADIPRREKYLAASYKSTYDQPFFDSPFEQRRLRALNALFLSLEKNDVRVGASGKNPQEFYATVGMTSVVVSIDDPKAERTSWRTASDLSKSASSVLVVKINKGSPVENILMAWTDQPHDKIEAHLAEVVANILVAGEHACREREFSHFEWLVKHRAYLIEDARKKKEAADEAERDRRLQLEKARTDRLLSEANALRQAEDIRAYVVSVRERNERSSEPASKEEVEDWAAWALAQADRIDPIHSRRFLQDRD